MTSAAAPRVPHHRALTSMGAQAKEVTRALSGMGGATALACERAEELAQRHEKHTARAVKAAERSLAVEPSRRRRRRILRWARHSEMRRGLTLREAVREYYRVQQLWTANFGYVALSATDLEDVLTYPQAWQATSGYHPETLPEHPRATVADLVAAPGAPNVVGRTAAA